MKRLSLFVLLVVIISLTAIAGYRQHQQVKSGQIIILTEAQSGRPGPVYVLMNSHQIFDKSSLACPIILWQDSNGQVWSQRNMVGARYANIVCKLPASSEELKLFRTYFPKIKGVSGPQRRDPFEKFHIRHGGKNHVWNDEDWKIEEKFGNMSLEEMMYLYPTSAARIDNEFTIEKASCGIPCRSYFDYH